jgi:predicted component of type VI protein secretion system
MYHLRLFHQSDPSRQIESRLIEGGELTVGRDPGVGWKVDDPDRAISRSHCVFSLSGGQLTVRDISSNGIFLGARTEPAPKGQAIPIQSGETIRFGRFNIVVEDASGAGFQKEPIIDSFSGTGGLAPGSSPFAPPAGMAEHGAQRRAPNPFGAELPRDPLAFDAPRAEPPLPTFNDDAWQQKPVRRPATGTRPRAASRKATSI